MDNDKGLNECEDECVPAYTQWDGGVLVVARSAGCTPVPWPLNSRKPGDSDNHAIIRRCGGGTLEIERHVVEGVFLRLGLGELGGGGFAGEGEEGIHWCEVDGGSGGGGGLL